MPVGVIGIDGMDYSITKRMMKSGYLPNTRFLSFDNEPHRISVILPHVSACVWTTYATGVNPGRHGIFDFFKTASMEDLNNSLDVKVPTIWDILSEHGLKNLVVNVPLTYPPKPVKGVMVAGVMTPDSRGLTYPRNIKEVIQPYVVESPLDFMNATGQDIVEEITKVFQLRMDAFLKLLDIEDFDFFFVVFNILDRLSHYFYGTEVLDDGYKIVDEAIGRIMEQCKGWDLIILSDHGFRSLRSYFFIEEWLRRRRISKVSVSNPLLPRSLLSFIPKLRGLVPKDRTLQRKVFHRYFQDRVRYETNSPISFYANSGHYLICDPSKKEWIKGELKRCKFLRVVRDGEDLYTGPHVDPRMVFVVGSKGYEVTRGFGNLTVPSKEHSFFPSRGAHRWEGAVSMSNVGSVPLNDIQVGPFLAKQLGVSYKGFDRGGNEW